MFQSYNTQFTDVTVDVGGHQAFHAAAIQGELWGNSVGNPNLAIIDSGAQIPDLYLTWELGAPPIPQDTVDPIAAALLDGPIGAFLGEVNQQWHLESNTVKVTEPATGVSAPGIPAIALLGAALLFVVHTRNRLQREKIAAPQVLLRPSAEIVGRVGIEPTTKRLRGRFRQRANGRPGGVSRRHDWIEFPIPENLREDGIYRA